MRLSKDNIKFIEQFKPKIAIIAPPLDSVPSPSGNAIYTLVETIVKHSKHPIVVFSISPNNTTDCSISERIVYYTKPFKSSTINNFLGYRLSKLLFKSVNLKYLSYYKWAYNLCKINNIRVVVHEEFMDMLHFIDVKNMKIILHQHAVINQPYWEKLIKKINEIIFVSETSRKVDNHFYIKNIDSRTIYNGIDLNDFPLKKQTENKDHINLLFVGRLHENKGIIDLINAIHEIKNEQIFLNIIGNKNTNNKNTNDFNEKFEDLLKKDSRVNFIGKVGQKDIAEYYNQNDFIIVPSKGKEGLPKVISEAVIMGKPIIASDRGGTKELVIDGKNGVIIENPVDIITIKNAIFKAIEIKKTLSQNALEQRDTFRNKLSHLDMVAQFDGLFNEKLQA